MRYIPPMSLSLNDLRCIRASLCHTFDHRFIMPPGEQLARSLQNLEAEIERLECVQRVTEQVVGPPDDGKVVSIELARAKRLLE